MHIGETIVAIRKEKGMSQAELAQKMGVKPQTISQYERGIKNPKPATIKKFADALGVDAAVLYAISTEQRDARVFKQLGIKPAELAEATEQADSEIAEPAFLQVLERIYDAAERFCLSSLPAKKLTVPDLTPAEAESLKRLSPEYLNLFMNMSRLVCDVSEMSTESRTAFTRSEAARIVAREIISAGNIPDAGGAAPAQVEQLLQDFNKLNPAGREKALERVHELTEVPRYTFPAVTPAPASTAESTQAAPQSPAANTDTPKGD